MYENYRPVPVEYKSNTARNLGFLLARIASIPVIAEVGNFVNVIEGNFLRDEFGAPVWGRPLIDNHPNEDSDGDGLSNVLESWYLGSNPNSKDTDGDGVDDYFEALPIPLHTTLFFEGPEVVTPEILQKHIGTIGVGLFGLNDYMDTNKNGKAAILDSSEFGSIDVSFLTDSDGDGTFDMLKDTDGNSKPDILEDNNGDGRPDGLESVLDALGEEANELLEKMKTIVSDFEIPNDLQWLYDYFTGSDQGSKSGGNKNK